MLDGKIKTGSIEITELVKQLTTNYSASNDFPQFLIDKIGLSDRYNVKMVESLPYNSSYSISNANVLVCPDGHSQIELVRGNGGNVIGIGMWWNSVDTNPTTSMGNMSSSSANIYIDYIYNTETDELLLTGHTSTGNYPGLNYIYCVLTENNSFVTIAYGKVYSAEGKNEFFVPSYSISTSGSSGFYDPVVSLSEKKDSLITQCILINRNNEMIKLRNIYIDFICKTPTPTAYRNLEFFSANGKHKYYFACPHGCGSSKFPAAVGFRIDI